MILNLLTLIDISLQEYANKTKNFSGAELAGLVRAANSFALLRSLKRENEQYQIDENEVSIFFLGLNLFRFYSFCSPFR